MKMKRMFFLPIAFVLISLALCMGIFAADGEIDIDFGVIIGGLASGSIGDDLSWTIDSDGTLTFSGEGDMPDFSEGELPWQEYADAVKVVVVENGVTSIGENVFGTSVEAVKIPSSVISIGEGALDGEFAVYVNKDSFAKEYAEQMDCDVKLVGDLDFNDSVDLDDAVYLLQHSLFENTYPVTDYALSVDLDANNSIDLDDAVLLLQHSLFPDVYPV